MIHLRRAVLLGAGVLAVIVGGSATASANTVTMTACVPGQALPQPPWSAVSSAPAGLTPRVNCASGGRLQLSAVGRALVPPHAYEQWSTSVPAAMSLRTFSFPGQAALLSTTLTNHPGGGTSGYNARFLSAVGSVTFIDDGQSGGGGMDYARAGTWAIGGRYFTLDVNCSRAAAPNGDCIQGGQDSADLLDIKDFTLVAEDDQPPAVSAPAAAPAGGTNLWSAGPWVRGVFNLAFTASNATGSGVCVTSAALAGRPLPSPAGAISTPNTSVWQQCPAAYLYQQAVDTTGYLNGRTNLDLYAADAASPNNTTPLTRTIGIDNAPVTIALSGPADVAALPANASADIAATATAGPSGVNIVCSVDGGPDVEYPGASAQVPVTGIGPHKASCYAQNNAVDATGAPARSTPETFGVSIRQPTAQALTFARLADALRCRRVVEKVLVRGRTRVVKRHGKKVLIRGRRHTIKRLVRRCHARTVKRTVWVVLKRHGKPVIRHGKLVHVRRVKRVVLLPHPVLKAQRRVAYGTATTVSGYLGLSDGTPLAGQSVAVIAAADNGLGQFTLPVATVTTSASGTWTATVPPGPSRLIEAVYAGNADDEPTTSVPVTLSVPARIQVTIVPHVIPWSGQVAIRGQLLGGYIPSDGVALRLLVAYPHLKHRTVLQALRTNSLGQFSFTWSYHVGRGVATYPFSVATTASESDYPFAASSSQPVAITFGRATPTTTTHHPTRHHRKQHHQRHS